MLLIREMKADDVEIVSKIESEVFSMPWSAKDFLEMVEMVQRHLEEKNMLLQVDQMVEMEEKVEVYTLL